MIINTGIKMDRIPGAKITDEGIFIPAEQLVNNKFYFSVFLGKADLFGSPISIKKKFGDDEKDTYLSPSGGRVAYSTSIDFHVTPKKN